MLWPLYWDGGASHPRLKEGYNSAGNRRLKEELGINCKLKNVGKFYYKSSYKKVGSENEICAILVGKYKGRIKVNPKEVADVKWLTIDELRKEFKKNPQKYTPWLKKGLNIYQSKVKF